LHAAAKLGLQGRQREKGMLNAATKLGLQGTQREQRVLNAATKLGLQGRQREQRVLNAATKLGLHSRCREKRVLNAATKLGLHSRREKRVLNAATLQGSREERMLRCHSSHQGGIIIHHKCVFSFIAAEIQPRCAEPKASASGTGNCDEFSTRCCHKVPQSVCADSRIFGNCGKQP
jgi:hypothetical protein